jgi:nitrite reductase/ring-hydroxylating ferredoxin subunit
MDAHEHEPNPRRGFFVRVTAVFVGAVCGAVPFLAGLAFLADPLIRKDETDGGDGFLPLGIGPEALPDDGTPLAVNVVADRVDAWNVYPQQPIGSVWLRKDDQGNVAVFSTTCPHLGCYIDYRAGQRDFFCPCHASTFNLDGQRQNRIPPRDMDTLELTVREEKLWVRFQKFRGATAEKVPV